MPLLKHLYYIRHGQSVANAAEIWTGSQETPLSEEGRSQAKKAGEKAAADGLKFDVIFCSPLSRARETATYIAQATGYPIEDIIVRNDLIERTFGELEGTSNKDAKAMYLLHESKVDHYKNVEKLTDLRVRTDGVLKFIMSRPEDTILVVGHGAFVRTLRRSIKNLPLDSHVDPYPNAEIFKLM